MRQPPRCFPELEGLVRDLGRPAEGGTVDTIGPVRRAFAAGAAITIGLSLAGMPAARATASSASTLARVVTPQIEVDHAGSTSRFSPNGDHRTDQVRVRFRLGSPADVTVVVRDGRRPVRGAVRLGRLGRGQHDWTWDGRDDGGAVVADGDYRVRLRAATGGVASRWSTTSGWTP